MEITILPGIEARRYRDYDVFRSRVRVIQENLFANALNPSQGTESHDWRAELSRDYNTSLMSAKNDRWGCDHTLTIDEHSVVAVFTLRARNQLPQS
nr:DUF2270 domain-containing protein [Halalkalirubrum salinum]